MDHALQLAQEALARGDWPTGSVIVREGRVLGSGGNRQNTLRDVTQHAEIEALRAAFEAADSCDLTDATLYSTMEPCPMCAEAMRMARISRLVLGLRHADLDRADLGSYSMERFCAMMGWPLEIVGGVRHAQCLEIRLRWGRDQRKV